MSRDINKHVIMALLTLLVGFFFTTLTFANEPIQPLPTTIKLDQNKVALGAALFHDKGLSSTKTISCASCHNLTTGGVDRLKVSNGIMGRKGDINSPTVFNSGFNFRQFWDGRAATLEDQVDGPLNNPKEMGSNWKQAVAYLLSKSHYRDAFKKTYPNKKINKETVSNAIAVFERSLITPSRFDDYLRGNSKAITDKEKKGYALFKSYGCASCHNGINIGGNSYQKFGVVHDYFKERGHITKPDYGRYNVTHKDADRFFFKVPTLRNVALTWPYFHDGSTKSLTKAIQIMGEDQLGVKISDKDAKLIEAFLKSLTGKNLEKKTNH